MDHMGFSCGVLRKFLIQIKSNSPKKLPSEKLLRLSCPINTLHKDHLVKTVTEEAAHFYKRF